MIIYKITNKQNGFVYVGQTSKTIEKRWQQHCWTASKNKYNYALYNAIRKYGASSFTVEQIDIACTKDELNEKEKYWISFYDCKAPNGYNLTDGGEGVVGNKISEETRAKLVASHIGQTAWNKGKKMSDAVNKKNSESTKKVWQREDYINHTNRGQKIHTIEHIVEMSNHWKGTKNPRAKAVICVETGERFETVNKAAETMQINSPSITQCLIGHNKTAGGYHWEYAEVKNG